MTAVMIGVDPHKGSHTAVAIGAAEEPLGRLRVRASAAQADKLVAWALAWPVNGTNSHRAIVKEAECLCGRCRSCGHGALFE